jgi:hypothetical protein
MHSLRRCPGIDGIRYDQKTSGEIKGYKAAVKIPV